MHFRSEYVKKCFYTWGSILQLATSHTKGIIKYLLIKWMTWIFLVCNMLLWINYPRPEWLQSEWVQSNHFLLNAYESGPELLRAQSVAMVKVTSAQTQWRSIINCHLLVSNHCYKITSNMMKMDLHTCSTQCKLKSNLSTWFFLFLDKYQLYIDISMPLKAIYIIPVI